MLVINFGMTDFLWHLGPQQREQHHYAPLAVILGLDHIRRYIIGAHQSFDRWEAVGVEPVNAPNPEKILEGGWKGETADSRTNRDVEMHFYLTSWAMA
jgi:hypothetical protein